MKMVMTLSAQESGLVFFNKRPGAILDGGSVIAHLGKLKINILNI